MINDWKEKLKVFMIALEITNIDDFMNNADIKDYEILGKLITDNVKEVQKSSYFIPIE